MGFPTFWPFKFFQLQLKSWVQRIFFTAKTQTNDSISIVRQTDSKPREGQVEGNLRILTTLTRYLNKSFCQSKAKNVETQNVSLRFHEFKRLWCLESFRINGRNWVTNPCLMLAIYCVLFFSPLCSLELPKIINKQTPENVEINLWMLWTKENAEDNSAIPFVSTAIFHESRSELCTLSFKEVLKNFWIKINVEITTFSHRLRQQKNLKFFVLKVQSFSKNTRETLQHIKSLQQKKVIYPKVWIMFIAS